MQNAQMTAQNAKGGIATPVKGKPFSLLGRCIELCSAKPASIVFPDGEDVRAVEAAIRLSEEGLGNALLLGKPFAIRTLLRDTLSKVGHVGKTVNVRVLDPASPSMLERNTQEFMELMSKSGKQVTAEDARSFMASGPGCGAMMVRRGEVEAGVGGNISSTSDMIRAALRVIGVKPGGKTISSFFFMIAPVGSYDHRQVLVFADCGVIPEPSAEQLVDVAVDSADQFQLMTGEAAKVAMLSFSTNGSAKHPRAKFIREVVDMVRSSRPDLSVDGELQFDAAMVPEVAAQKVKNSPVAGEANVLVFPSLEAGNIGYKIAQRLGGYTAIGPLLQGLNGCWHDLSRGCSAEDIYQVSLIGAALNRAQANMSK